MEFGRTINFKISAKKVNIILIRPYIYKHFSITTSIYVHKSQIFNFLNNTFNSYNLDVFDSWLNKSDKVNNPKSINHFREPLYVF